MPRFPRKTKSRIVSDETKNKIRLANTGKHPSEETRKKLIESHKGKHPSEETRKKMSEAQMGEKHHRFGKHLSEEHKRKIGEKNKGHKHSEEVKKKIGLASKGNTNTKGKKFSKETKLKMSLSHQGNKSYLWNGGISFEPYTIDWTRTLRRAIRERDRYTCQICKEEGAHVHHIDYNKKNCNPENLITLCIKCHPKTNINRIKWISYFKNGSY
jgi:hypothetical protein